MPVNHKKLTLQLKNSFKKGFYIYLYTQDNQQPMDTMDTLSEIIEKLRKEGYTADLNIQQNSLECNNGAFQIHHDEFVIDKVYRFEGESDPADEATLYAISSAKHGIKGILVNGAGIYTDDLTDEMLESLQIKKRKKG